MEEQSRRTMNDPIALLLGSVMLIGAVFVGIGSFGPWATELGVGSINGLTDWGIVTLALGTVSGIAAVAYIVNPIWRGWDALIMLIAFGAASIIGSMSWINISDEGLGSLAVADAGWGVQLVTWAALVGALTSFVALMDWALAPDEVLEEAETEAESA